MALADVRTGRTGTDDLSATAADSSGFDRTKGEVRDDLARIREFTEALRNEFALIERDGPAGDAEVRGERTKALTAALKGLVHDTRKKLVSLAQLAKSDLNKAVHYANELCAEAEQLQRGMPPEQLTALATQTKSVQNDLKSLLHRTRKANVGYKQKLVFDEVSRKSRIRTLCLAEIFPGIERLSVPIGAINELGGHPNKVDLLFVAAIAMYREARRIFEFGTYTGRTTYHLSLASADARVFTLNLPPEQEPRLARYLGSYFKNTDAANRITQIYADSTAFDPTPYAKQMDYIFVDADHSYELVKNDTEKALQMLAPGGVMVWHDYASKSPGVVQFIKELSETRPVFRIRNTCLVLYIDGVNAIDFQAAAYPPSAEFDSPGLDDD